MSDKEMLLDYMTRFRLECHCRLDMVPADIKEFPIFMYKGAHDTAKENMVNELGLSNEEVSLIDEVGEFFLNKLQELDHYGKADDFIVNEIERGRFSK